MGSRLGRRVIHFANLPIKLLMPSSFNSIKEIALKTIPSATKIEIKRVLESLYGFDVEEVRTLNMEGKKKKRGGILLAKPDYKKAYVTLKYPLSISPDIYPIRVIEDEKKRLSKESKSGIVDENEQEVKSHWLEGSGNKPANMRCGYITKRGAGDRANRMDRVNRGDRGTRGNRNDRDTGTAKFPWSSMRTPK
ncbi:hypothetical protein AQUCO_01000214v1 [Aquilegia coerulea]|uniref:Large ribosomal subunit protein uL23m n=1 Tax=Aquilegia coerulea TaxID=218851 RepID=A0A2G5E8V1_AQUCA|nr:hypothetical protein AQUCO_01000214v1 [Aquilegia coerulea]